MASNPFSLLLELLQHAHVAVEDMTAQFMADAYAAMTELGITDAEIRDATASELETLARTTLMNTYREEAAAAADETNPDAYVYLGPDDAVERPFCAELNGTWLTADEIDQLDNGQMDDAMSTCGGWNCRHQWLPLFGDQTSEYEHGDVEAANGAAA